MRVITLRYFSVLILTMGIMEHSYCQNYFNERTNTKQWAIPTGLIIYDSIYRVIGSGENIVQRSRLRVSDFTKKGKLTKDRFYGDTSELVIATGVITCVAQASNGDIAIGGSVLNKLGKGNSYFMLLDKYGDSLKFTEIIRGKLQANYQV